jgi:hypothetical protein
VLASVLQRDSNEHTRKEYKILMTIIFQLFTFDNDDDDEVGREESEHEAAAAAVYFWQMMRL